MRSSISWCACLLLLGVAGVTYGQPLEFSDDFLTVKTYDIDDLFPVCPATPPKYTVFEAVGDPFTVRAVSGPRRHSLPAGKLYTEGEILLSDNTTTGGGGLEDERFNFIQVGWLGLGFSCPGEPPLKESTMKFTSPNVCMYGGIAYHPWALRFDRPNPPAGINNDCDRLLGVDGLPGAVGFDDDGDGTTDGGIGNPGVDDDVDGTTDEALEVIECDESPNRLAPDTPSGFAGPNTPDNSSNTPSFYKGGPDGKPGVAGVDDDGNGVTDDVGETAFAGGDDGDDGTGRLFQHIFLRSDINESDNIHINMDPGSGGGNIFSIRSFVKGAEIGLKPNNTIGGGFYNAWTHYNYVFCNTNTVFGAQLWITKDIGNPAETVGPFVNTQHTELEDNGVVLTTAIGHEALSRDFIYKGNQSYSETFWVVSGDPAVFFPSVTADLDGDRDVDGTDFLTFSNCFNGALNPPTAPCDASDGLNKNNLADLDCDGDVDGTDFLTFSNCFNGALNRPLCISTLADTTAGFTPPPPFADPFPGDTCATANSIGDVVDLEGNIGFSNTNTVDATCRGDDDGKDIWYEYTATCTGTATVSTCNLVGNCTFESSPFADDTLLLVFDACGGTEVVCQEFDNCPSGATTNTNGETITFAATSGTTYFIAVQGEDFPFDGPGDSDLGCYTLNVSCTP